MRKPILFISFLAATSLLSAQINSANRHYLELGLMVGACNYSGDLSEPDIQINQSRPAFGVFARYHLSENFILKGQFSSGRIFGDDKRSDTRAPRQFRVSGPIHELSAVLEYAPLNFGFESTNGGEFYFFPYLFAGVGGTFVKAEAEYYGPAQGREIYIKTPFPEDGSAQRTLLCTPVGGGIRVNINQRITLGVEGGWRPVYSDLLDGISKNGNPEANDWYYFGGITVSYYLNGPWKKRVN